VLAHPDDESMFFTPAITQLLRTAASLHLLCLSTGNYDGLGSQRSREVCAAARVLGISTCTVIDDADIQDGPSCLWPLSSVMRRISESSEREAATHIFTFDAGGVSGHPNHIASHRACVEFVRERPHLRLLTLRTSPLLLKYLGVFAVMFPPRAAHQQHVVRICNALPHLVVRAMREHGSQLTWFRWLFIIFSHYTYFNDVVAERA
jgi:N-acetylglucosaminylphosphatidylinositol deacetylase